MNTRNVAAVLWMAVGAAVFSGSGQPTSTALVVNPEEAKWIHEPRDPAGSESVMLREDARTGGLELLARYPGGHVFAPHWHEANERILLLEGQLSIGEGANPKILNPGGYAYLPAREVQRMACVSRSRCVFYVAWDGPPKSHKAAP